MIEPRRFYGKYRGVVVNNADPKQIGRVQATVSDVVGLTPTTWAMPCVPLAGLQMGLFGVPPIGAGVWVEFEQGDPDYPIWSGCWWGGREELPALALATVPNVTNIVLQTLGQCTLQISDAPPGGTIMLKTAGGASITISDTGGIVMTDGQGGTIVVTKGIVSINGTALVVK
jgi:uncharacterized protein involved in type VI secretion and phage assembly